VVFDKGLITNFTRITQPISDFIRGNPIVSTAAIGAGTTGLILGATTLVKRRKARKKAKVKKRRKPRKKNGRIKRKRKTRATRKRVVSVFAIPLGFAMRVGP